MPIATLFDDKKEDDDEQDDRNELYTGGNRRGGARVQNSGTSALSRCLQALRSVTCGA